jgi:ABC-type bacteriocin/lantibiotic exporter with double-glycine peptidase domain
MKRRLLSALILAPLLISLLCACDMGGNSETASVTPAHHLIRISQLDRQQYASDEEYTTWSPSTCSTASMTEIVNVYSQERQYRITDILHYQIRANAISPELGLLDNAGIARTLEPLGFRVDYHALSLDQVIDLANSGTPVLVDFPPTLWKGGHLLVVTGGNKGQVFLADSSLFNMQVMTRQIFRRYWAGFVAVITPQEQGGQS